MTEDSVLDFGIETCVLYSLKSNVTRDAEFSHEIMSAIKVLDGGFSTQLSTHVGEKIDGDPLWTARFLATNPKAVVATHLDFLRAGADIIETNTYQASIDGFIKYLNVTKEESLVLFQRAVSYARQAVNEYKEEIKDNKNVVNPNPLVAGSVGPYGAAQHDGSEYTGAYAKRVSIEVLKEWHRPHIRALIDSGVDILALETIPCKHEAEALIDLLKEFPETKAWLTFSCRDDGVSLAEGSNFQETAIACYKSALPGQLVAVGVNCIAPKCVSSLFKGINKHKSKDFVPLIVYPNSGEKYTVAHGWKRDGEWYPLEQFIGQWLDLGVRYVGGCCRTYATDVKRIRAEVNLWQEKERESIKKHASEEI